jgi:hypothetical protein
MPCPRQPNNPPKPTSDKPDGQSDESTMQFAHEQSSPMIGERAMPDDAARPGDPNEQPEGHAESATDANQSAENELIRV